MWINIQLTQNAKKLTKTNCALKASKAQVLITTRNVIFMILIALDQAFFKTWKTYQHSKIHSGRQNNRNDNNTGHNCYWKKIMSISFKFLKSSLNLIHSLVVEVKHFIVCSHKSFFQNWILVFSEEKRFLISNWRENFDSFI